MTRYRLSLIAARFLGRRALPRAWRITREPRHGTHCLTCGRRITRTQPACGMPDGFVHTFKRDCAAVAR